MERKDLQRNGIISMCVKFSMNSKHLPGTGSCNKGGYKWYIEDILQTKPIKFSITKLEMGNSFPIIAQMQKQTHFS